MKKIAALFLLISATVVQADNFGHQIDLTIIGNNHYVDIIQSGLGNHKLDLIVNNSNISEIIIIQSGDGPWTVEVDGVINNWPEAVTIGGICNSTNGCSLVLK